MMMRKQKLDEKKKMLIMKLENVFDPES